MLTFDNAIAGYPTAQPSGGDLSCSLSAIAQRHPEGSPRPGNFGIRPVDNANKHAEGEPATTQGGGAFLFGEFRVVSAARILTRNGSPVQLGARALDILIALIERAGQVVSKAELFSIVWPTTFVEESNLRFQIFALRKALGDGRSGTRFILNVAGRGYMFVGEAKRTSGCRSVGSIPNSATAA
jgi:DNA-binding winged helix-turn-helix (wHTH) protein